MLPDENRRLKHAVEELSILNDPASAIGASLDPREIIGTIVRKSLRAVNAEQGVIHLVDTTPSDPMKTLVREMASSHEHFRINQTLVGWMHLKKKPLMIKSEVKGVLTVYNRKTASRFTEVP